MWSIHKYQGTELSEAGVTQVTMKGKLFPPWNEVEKLRIFGKAYILDSPRGSVIITPSAYEDPFAVAEYVTSHMRKIMEEQGAKVMKKR